MKKTYDIIGEGGIHARPATILVNTASRFESEIFLGVDSKRINLKSIMGLMSLGIKSGCKIELDVDGNDEGEAVDALEQALKDNGLIA